MIEDRKHRLIETLKGMLADLAGKDLSGVDAQATFFELGFDSLLLTQVATLLKRRFQVKVTFRQMLEELTSLETMARYLDAQLPAEATPAKASASAVPVLPPSNSPIPPAAQPVVLNAPASRPVPNLVSTNGNSLLERVIKDQVALMTRQLEMLRGKPAAALSQTESNALQATMPKPAAAALKTGSHAEAGDLKRFGPFKGIELGPKGGLTSKQEKALADLAARYNRRTAGSKAYAQRHRSYFCDPRAAGNFRLLWKEMVYPIVCAKSKGGKMPVGPRRMTTSGSHIAAPPLAAGVSRISESARPSLAFAVREGLKDATSPMERSTLDWCGRAARPEWRPRSAQGPEPGFAV